MRPVADPSGDLIAAAALEALMEARWRALDLLARKPRDEAPGRLRGLASDMSFSPIARDQVLSVALSAAAEALEHEDDLNALGVLDVLKRLAPSEEERLAVRREALGTGSTPTTDLRQVVEAMESRYRPDCRSSADLARQLRTEASLHELLWDHPRLSCDCGTRLVMVCSVPQLLKRAAEIDPKGAHRGWRSWAVDACRAAERHRAFGGMFAARG